MKKRERNTPAVSADQLVEVPELPPKISIISRPDSVLSIYEKLKQLQTQELPPAPKPTISFNIIPENGKDFDSITEITPINPIKNKMLSLAPSKSPIIEKEKKNDMHSILNYDKPLGFGLYRSLSYLVTHSMLHKPDGDIIEHLDDFGNVADAKAAFKHQSHVFSGKTYSEKSMKRKKLLYNARIAQDNTELGDTPLKTRSNLSQMLNEVKQPYIELTGPQQRVLPVQFKEEEPEKSQKNRIKRLKKAKKDSV